MLKDINLEKISYIHELSLGVCKITFRKRTNGRFRSIFATLNKDMIPGSYQKTLKNALTSRQNSKLIPIYDINEQTWKSFYTDSVLYFMTTDKLKTNRRY